ncbi:MAG: HAD-IA family hydrolase [Actinomycetota bacterium]|nr:HAD-IA family hydrolase [Actinomycetota bacterium]
MTTLLFGSISTLADTSELQRAAFNAAFAQHGLDWTWGRDEYVDLLRGNGGADRIAAYAKDRGQEVDSAAVHRTKSQLFQDSLATSGVTPRPGVAETISAARADGMTVALVTTTSSDNVSALLQALAPQVRAEQFDLVVDATDVETPKPDPAAYTYALTTLGRSPADCVAIEDNEGGVAAATSAGIPTVAFPNANTTGHDFAAADSRTDTLELAALSQLVHAGEA